MPYEDIRHFVRETEKIMSKTHSSFVTIIGRPNVGKSTLLNALLGEKIAITSDRPQTTRTKIMGVLTLNETQIVFTDTPGMLAPKNKLGHHMKRAILDAVTDVDMIILVVEAFKEIGEIELSLIESIKARKNKAILVINKTDCIKDKERLAALILKYSRLYDFEEIIPASAQNGYNLDVILNTIVKNAPQMPHFFPDDTLTDQPEKVIAAELIREKLLTLLHDEVPHGVAVSIDKMRQREGRELMDISATIFCEKKSHKGIIIGKSGVMLKKIGELSRKDLEEFLGMPVNLQCWVKISEDWRNKEGLIKEFGLSDTE